MFHDYLKIILNTTFIYFFIVLFLRVLGKKELGQLSAVDLVFILLISNAVQNSMLGSNPSFIAGVVSAMTLFFWNFILKILLYKYTKFSSLLLGKPTILIKDGKIQKQNLEKTKISYEDLYESMRQMNVNKTREVKLAILERDGKISFLTKYYPNRSRSLRNRKNKVGPN